MLHIAPWYPAEATESELRAYYQLALATFAVDRPGVPSPSFDAMAARLRSPLTPLGPARYWLAWEDSDLVGVAIIILPEAENANLTVTELRVPPQLRRRGIGTKLLRAVLPMLRAEGRDLVTCQGLAVGGDGEGFAVALGFDRTDPFVLQALVPADVDPAVWDVPVPDGYRLERWINEAPTHLLESFAHARGAIHDAPLADSHFQLPAWTPERVRSDEDEARTRGVETRVVVAVRVNSDDVVGFTEIEIHPAQPGYAMQRDTAVLAEHRGHGLGRALKAAMMRWLLDENPDLERVATSTAGENTHMIRVNHQIGYVTTLTMVDVEADRTALEARSSQQ
jgi:mycothiol synthase